MIVRTELLRFFAFAYAACSVQAIPQPVPQEAALGKRQSLQDLFSCLQQAAKDVADPYPSFLSALESISPTAAPTSIQQIQSILRNAYLTVKPIGYLEQAAALIANGISSSNLKDIIDNSPPENSVTNKNPALPKSKSVYPKKEARDAPYDMSAKELREQIYIPDGFTYGKKPPVILISGTGERAGSNYAGNYRKLLAGNPHADLLWVNYPGYGLDDAQDNAEVIAYAINYIAGLTGKNVTVLTWSQGSLNVQWALKYWPSARKVVSNHIAFSPDYHGTIVASVLNPINPSSPLPPSLIQQKYNSNYIKTLRANGGDSAYVPTTTVYSGFFDEIVEPQQGKGASGFLKNGHDVGVTNIDIPRTCALGSPAGLFADHESVLSNSLSYALAVDALKHGGPAKLRRINLDDACSRAAAPGLSVEDVLKTEITIPSAVARIVVYPAKAFFEPPIKAYAREQAKFGL